VYVYILIASTAAASVGLLFKLSEEESLPLADFNAMRWVFGMLVLIPYIWIIEAKKFPCPRCPDEGRQDAIIHATLIVSIFYAFTWACSILTITQIVSILTIAPFIHTFIRWHWKKTGVTLWDVLGLLGCGTMVYLLYREDSMKPLIQMLNEDGLPVIGEDGLPLYNDDDSNYALGLTVVCVSALLTAIA
jgi:hypothetical protein